MHIDKNKNKGFTLVELVIVVAILAILFGILAPAYSKYVERSAESTDLENEVGAGKKIPVIISTAAGKYYVSESTTADRKGSGSSYVAISGHLTQADYKKIIADGQNYNTLQEAYDAYEKELTDGKYKQYKNTLQ